jgi:aldehyde:ferredoxin oxidoreductase
MHVKGLETPMHEPRGMQSLGLAYATALRGCDHLSANTNVIEMFGMPVEDLGIPANLSEFTFEDVDRKARTFAWAVKRSQDFWTLHDTLIMCKFTTIAYQIPPRKFSTMLYSVTGKTFEFREVIKIGERVFNLVRRIMVDRGIDKKDDTLPKRFLRTGLPRHEPQGKKGEIKDFDRMIEEYYSIRGWDDRGIPLESTLSSLEIFEEM